MASLDEVMNAVLDEVIAQGGHIATEPGQLIKQVAGAIECDYFATATAIQRLESIGFLTVERWSRPEAHRANKLVRIELVE